MKYFCFFLLSLFLLISGCATIFNSKPQKITLLPSNKKKVQVSIQGPNGTYKKTIPAEISVTPHFKNSNVLITVDDDCYKGVVSVEKHTTMVYWANVLNFYGFLIDPLTGKVWEYERLVNVPVADRESLTRDCENREEIEEKWHNYKPPKTLYDLILNKTLFDGKLKVTVSGFLEPLSFSYLGAGGEIEYPLYSHLEMGIRSYEHNFFTSRDNSYSKEQSVHLKYSFNNSAKTWFMKIGSGFTKNEAFHGSSSTLVSNKNLSHSCHFKGSGKFEFLGLGFQQEIKYRFLWNIQFILPYTKVEMKSSSEDCGMIENSSFPLSIGIGRGF